MPLSAPGCTRRGCLCIGLQSPWGRIVGAVAWGGVRHGALPHTRRHARCFHWRHPCPQLPRHFILSSISPRLLAAVSEPTHGSPRWTLEAGFLHYFFPVNRCPTAHLAVSPVAHYRFQLVVLLVFSPRFVSAPSSGCCRPRCSHRLGGANSGRQTKNG